MSTSDFEEGPLILGPKAGDFQEHLRTPRGNTLCTVVLTALISSAVSIVVAVIIHSTILPYFGVMTPDTVRVLPDLDVPPLGHVLRTYLPQPEYRHRPDNKSNEAWMSLLPRGHGYISIDKVKETGPIPDLVENVNTDNSGRYCVAVFHQLHCLYLIYSDYFQALEGGLTQSTGHATHCFDYLRQSLMCTADSNLEPIRSRFDGMKPGDGVDGIGSVHQCRNFEHLFEWTNRYRWDD